LAALWPATGSDRPKVQPNANFFGTSSRCWSWAGPARESLSGVVETTKPRPERRAAPRARGAHINTAESYFAIFKRGIYGTYHHVSQRHLKRYLSEFDFRYNERSALGVEDSERTTKALRGIVGKRLTYRGSRVGPLIG
jgi:hypothetical protein